MKSTSKEIKEEEIMNLQKGDTIRTSLSDNTIVLDIEDNRATLFTGNQFVVVGGIDFNERKVSLNGREEDMPIQ